MSNEPPAPPAPTPPTPSAPPSPPAEPYYKGLYNEDGTLNAKNWERLPDELKDLRPTLERQQTFDDVLRTFKNQQVLVGKKALAPLPTDAPAEAIEARNKLLDDIKGVPADAKAYGIARPPELPESQWNQPLADAFAAWAKKAHVSPAEAKELLSIQVNAIKGQLQAQGQYEQQFWAKEQTSFEGAVRTQQMPLDRANSLVEKGAIAFGMDLTNDQTKTFLKGSQARLMCMQHAISIGEDSAVTDTSPTGQGGGDLSARIKEARADPAYWNKDQKYSRTDHEGAVARVNELLRLQADREAKAGERKGR